MPRKIQIVPYHGNQAIRYEGDYFISVEVFARYVAVASLHRAVVKHVRRPHLVCTSNIGQIAALVLARAGDNRVQLDDVRNILHSFRKTALWEFVSSTLMPTYTDRFVRRFTRWYGKQLEARGVRAG